MSAVEPGAELPDLSVTPDRLTTVRYAGASGDFNPIHVDGAFARSVGLPGCILHGLWTMAQVARAQTEGLQARPDALRSLAVEFRGMGVPEEEIVVSATVAERDGTATVTRGQAKQAGKRIVRNAEATVDPGA